MRYRLEKIIVSTLPHLFGFYNIDIVTLYLTLLHTHCHICTVIKCKLTLKKSTLFGMCNSHSPAVFMYFIICRETRPRESYWSSEWQWFGTVVLWTKKKTKKTHIQALTWLSRCTDLRQLLHSPRSSPSLCSPSHYYWLAVKTTAPEADGNAIRMKWVYITHPEPFPV